ncbi:glycerol dehydratase reactivase beta/small subunit family protein [Clostridium sp. D2Q-14]|uniref:glycerol dehydratase reactivase beta/small subunit family protein n=1 Tax=Anaeromonas gelatinilytica TaxID=2683194 RepID=UPI00193C033F|nr:glycerol dehydratase reactivase beta/small subunit family protein [Anaeromonas gelatinilytica]MBS4534543.1 glycerol dehydratase reactivase beta/small subunit family protein [Anaeromonas gelatinilytica]
MNNNPTINVYYSNEIKDWSLYTSLLWGIEEEGLPYQCVSKELNNAVKLAYDAAESSRLSVGIGIDNTGDIILHYQKLDKNKPLFKINIDEGHINLRNLGANSARLIKGIPFKTFKDKNVEEKFENLLDIEKSNEEDIDIEKIVTEVVEKLCGEGV